MLQILNHVGGRSSNPAGCITWVTALSAKKKNPIQLKLLVVSDAICECDQKLNCPRTVTLLPLQFILLQALERQKAFQEITYCWMQ